MLGLLCLEYFKQLEYSCQEVFRGVGGRNFLFTGNSSAEKAIKATKRVSPQT